MTLPDSRTLIDAVRELPPAERDAYLNEFTPGIDAMADTAEIAAWLHMSPATIKRERKPDRARANGTTWPQPDRRYGSTPAWTYRTVVLHRASQPGKGTRTTSPGRAV